MVMDAVIPMKQQLAGGSWNRIYIGKILGYG
jgi:hypothetical protein